MDVDDKPVETKIIASQQWISRHVCVNYDPDSPLDGQTDFDDMVELVWEGVFKDLIDGNISNDSNTLHVEAILWCEENCKGLVYANRFSGRFKFELIEDAMAFKLRWI